MFRYEQSTTKQIQSFHLRYYIDNVIINNIIITIMPSAIRRQRTIVSSLCHNPQEGDQQQQQQQQRPWDTLGPPTNPLKIDEPKYELGYRRRVLCYDPPTETYEYYDNVLIRDTNEISEYDVYYTVPDRAKITTKSGWIEICHVLKKRRIVQPQDNDGNVDRACHGGECVFEMTTDCVAVKVSKVERIAKMRQDHEKEDALREIAILQLLGDDVEHVATCREVLFDPTNNSYHVVLPYFQGGDLLEHLEVDRHVGEDAARFLFREIMQGLRNLHDKGICHHDLSPENIMIHQGHAYIIDYGMSLRVPYDDKQQRCLIKRQGTYGKIRYMSQEVYQNQDFDGEAIDVWSAGIVLWCMVTGYCSYQIPHRTDGLFYHMTTRGNFPKLLKSYGCALSYDCADLLESMLQVDPRERLSIDEVLQHPWLRDSSVDPVE